MKRKHKCPFGINCEATELRCKLCDDSFPNLIDKIIIGLVAFLVVLATVIAVV